MAGLTQDRFGNFAATFRLGGKSFKGGLGTKDQREAENRAREVDLTLDRLKQGLLVLPDGADPKIFVLTGGRQSEPIRLPERAEPPASSERTIRDLIDCWLETYPRETNTRKCNQAHLRHAQQLLGAEPFSSLTLARIQDYVNARLTATHGTKPIEPTTIRRKELRLLYQAWSWAYDHGHTPAAPTVDRNKLIFHRKDRGREPFRTYGEIRALVETVPGEDQGRLWEALYLTEKEVIDSIDYALAHASRPFIGPMVAMAGLTGMRQSEMIRSLCTDWNFEKQMVNVREKKRQTAATFTMRRVSLPARLCRILESWFERQPSQWTLSHEDGSPILDHQAQTALGITFRGHPDYCLIPGFHTYRHSYASVLAARNTPEATLMALMGHVDRSTLDRYRHFYPDHLREALQGAFD